MTPNTTEAQPSRRSEEGAKSRRSKSRTRKHSAQRHQQNRALHKSEPNQLQETPARNARLTVLHKQERRRSFSQEPHEPYKCWLGIERPPRRRPRRRAVVVGCNYSASSAIKLKGSVNDAHLFALALTNLFEFHPQNILLLTDELPDPVLLTQADAANFSDTQMASCLPLRTHILLGLQWLTTGVVPGDILVFYFAGHGLQIDNMAGWEGEGYDESILPLDRAHASGDVNAITAVSIRQLLLSVDEDVQLSIFLDCTGGQTMLDPAGTGTWKYIKGVKQKGLWPFVTDPTFKMERARYDPSVWTSEAMRKKEVRPRFIPGVEVGNTQDLLGAIANHSFENPSTKLRGFQVCAAPWDEVAVEGRLPSLGIRALTPAGTLSTLPVITANKAVIHGVFTWSLVRAMNDCAIGSAKAYSGDKTISFRTLMRETIKNVQFIRDKQGFSKLNQMPSITHYMASGSNLSELIFYPFGGRSKTAKYSDATEVSQLQRTESTWLPKRDEYMSAWQAQVALTINGQQGQRMPWKAQHTQYKEFWKTQMDNDPKYAARYLDRKTINQVPPYVVHDTTAPLTPSDSTAAQTEHQATDEHHKETSRNQWISLPTLAPGVSASHYSSRPALTALTRSLTLAANEKTSAMKLGEGYTATGRSMHHPWFQRGESPPFQRGREESQSRISATMKLQD
eukprot:Gregarina_sp_Poly_1__3661@NODE_207_length_11414_cov_43_030493_g184_i0_p2_GENE_NODE_207_length_11414_cov_43_030493_g184_i0NODE_207_length_11414_cov_43_030493_g184_i0_p2_ORF_typecomplete_len680_score80_46Peptidase_C14/PF00656_22/7e32_NODE_207_length_11414_cov_43_030493_g184_i050637102